MYVATPREKDLLSRVLADTLHNEIDRQLDACNDIHGCTADFCLNNKAFFRTGYDGKLNVCSYVAYNVHPRDTFVGVDSKAK